MMETVIGGPLEQAKAKAAAKYDAAADHFGADSLRLW